MRPELWSDARNRPHQSIKEPRWISKTWLLVLLLLGCSISWSVHDLQVHPSSKEAGVQINPKGNYIFPNVGGLLAGMQAGWLTGCVLPGWWCMVAANLLLMHAKQCHSINTGLFLKPPVWKSTRIHWRTRK